MDIAHVLGTVAKWTIVVVVFAFSATLSYMFFASIAPPDKPWFVFASMGLTEGGFLLWMATFMLTHHHPIHKGIALIMTCACGVSSLAVAGYEFYTLMEAHYSVASVTWLVGGVSILLEIIFAAHLSALVIDLLASYFARPGHTFRSSPLPASVRVVEAQSFSNTGTMKAIPQQASSKMAFADAAAYVLEHHANGQPMHYKDITRAALDQGLLATKGKTPAATMGSQIVAEVNSGSSRFVRVGSGRYTLVKRNNP